MRFLLLFFLLFSSSYLLAETAASADTAGLEAEGTDDFESGFDAAFEEEFKVETADEFDPLSDYNRAMTTFNDGLFTNVLFPVARGYRYVVPEPGREAVSKFFNNLHFPVRFVNNLLQLKLLNTGEETLRFVVNSTVGLLGFFDPAEAWLGLEGHEEDFGQTLGHYGVGGGFHIVLPIFGPSNLRDTVGMTVDWYIDPAVYWETRYYNIYANYYEGLGVRSAELLNESSLHIEEYESLKKDAVDLYPFFKNVYRQNREKKISE